MSESIIIILLAIITLLLYRAAIKQRYKSKRIRKRMVDKAKRRDEL